MYATGLLAIGLAANDACAEAVRNGMAVELAKVSIAISRVGPLGSADSLNRRPWVSIQHAREQ